MILETGITEKAETVKPKMSRLEQFRRHAEQDEAIVSLGFNPGAGPTATGGRKRTYLPVNFTTKQFVDCIVETQDFEFVKLDSGEYRVMFTHYQ